MKISRDFGRIRDDDALVIVAGKQDAAFYRIKDGFMEKLDAFKIPHPRYSDSEGFSEMRGRGEFIASGWTRELQDRDVIKDFIREFKKRIKNVPKDCASVYLFAPSQTKSEIKGALPRQLSDKLKKDFNGNYFNSSPQAILEMLSEGKTVV